MNKCIYNTSTQSKILKTLYSENAMILQRLSRYIRFAVTVDTGRSVQPLKGGDRWYNYILVFYFLCRTKKQRYAVGFSNNNRTFSLQIVCIYTYKMRTGDKKSLSSLYKKKSLRRRTQFISSVLNIQVRLFTKKLRSPLIRLSIKKQT